MILHSAKIGPKLEALSKFCENLEHEEPFGGGPRGGQTKQKRKKRKIGGQTRVGPSFCTAPKSAQNSKHSSVFAKF